MQYNFNDGGRSATKFTGKQDAGDCVTRSIAIASGLPYMEVYNALSEGCKNQRTKKSASARNGVYTKRKWFKDYMRSIGFEWTATMQIGSGCKVHLRDGELPAGRLVAAVSKHYTAVIDGVINDNHDPQRDGSRCVYGYWRKT